MQYNAIQCHAIQYNFKYNTVSYNTKLNKTAQCSARLVTAYRVRWFHETSSSAWNHKSPLREPKRFVYMKTRALGSLERGGDET